MASSDDDNDHSFADDIDIRYDDSRPGHTGGGTRAGKKARKEAPKPDPKLAKPQAPKVAPAAETVVSDPSDKSKLPTAEDVMDKILWDPAYKGAKVVVCYEDRFKGWLYTDLAKFRFLNKAELTIPLHRIRQYLVNDAVIWDREKRLWDPAAAPPPLPTAPAAATAGSQPAPTAPDGPVAQQASKLDIKGERVTVLPPTSPISNVGMPAQLKVLNFNVLHDLFDAELIFTAQRLPLIARFLEQMDADVVFLQEATPRFLVAIRDASPMLCARYHWTTLPPDTNSCQATLSKFPIADAICAQTTGKKRCVFASLSLPACLLVTANVHLLSDFGINAVERRMAEFGKITKRLEKLRCPVILSGDFNFGDQNVEQRDLDWADYDDAWLVVQQRPRFDPKCDLTVAGNVPSRVSDVGGFTYDLSTNWLADKMSRGHRYPRRLDRTLVRNLTVESVAVVGNVSSLLDFDGQGPKPLFPSDHFGLLTVCTLSAKAQTPAQPIKSAIPSALGTAAPNMRTALVIVLPDELWPRVDAIRSKHDKAFPRWMPHITIAFPFVDIALFAEAACTLKAALGCCGPLDITMSKIGSFAGKREVLYIGTDAESNEGLASLYDCVMGCFPRLRRPGRDSFTAHATLGQWPEPAARQAKAELALNFADWLPRRFAAPKLQLIAHREHAPGYTVETEVDLLH